MESSNYTKKMSDLRDRVSKYDQTPKQNHSGIINTTIHNTKPLYFYIAIPCFILLILIIFNHAHQILRFLLLLLD